MFNNKLIKSSWDEAFDVIIKKLNETENSKIAGHLGDLVSLETTLAFKKFFELLGSNNLEFREKKFSWYLAKLFSKRMVITSELRRC